MALSLDGNSQESINRIAVVLACGMLVVVGGGACWDWKTRGLKATKSTPPAWALALLAYSYALLIPAIFVTLFSMKIGAVDVIVLEEASDSTLQFIQLLGETGSWLGAVMVAIFAIVVPLLKLGLLILGECWRCSKDKSRVLAARGCIRFVQQISKWACPDLIAYIFLFYLVHHLNHYPINGLFRLELGFTCYTLFCWGSTISSLGIHLPRMPESAETKTPKEPWVLRNLGKRGTATTVFVVQIVFLVFFVLGLSWSCLGLRLKPDLLAEHGLPEWQIQIMEELDVEKNAYADVTIFTCVEMLMKAQQESFDANAIFAVVMLVLFVVGLTLLDMAVLAVAAVQTLCSSDHHVVEDNRCNFITLAKYLKKMAMLDVLILGVLVVVLSGSVYQEQGLVLLPGWGLLALFIAELMHYLTYFIVRSLAQAIPANVAQKEMSDSTTTESTDIGSDDNDSVEEKGLSI
ncbi:unnamed protein product [Effrenium voratum]|uniref:Uncharacterized protein n=2 Tax=Effrenium voratum TaxID=2562239 RepID=A0AA36N1E5_9DINO|nr:unnamed protein product [Effrenium voratum]